MTAARAKICCFVPLIGSRHACRIAVSLLFLVALATTSAAQDASVLKLLETLQRGETLFEAKQYREVIDLLKPLAQGPFSSAALFLLSQSYGRLSDLRGFIDFALPLAQQGNVAAQYYVAGAYENSRPPKLVETLRWYRAASDGGDGLAAAALGRIYFTGYVGSDENDQAAKLLFREIEQGEKQFKLCLQLSQRQPIKSCRTGLALIEMQRPQRSVESILRLLDEAEDYSNLFLIHEFGLLTPPDRNKALEVLAKLREQPETFLKKYFLAEVAAYQKSEPAGLRNMALRLKPSLNTYFVTDANTFVRLLKAASDRADDAANWWMAHISMNGQHVPRDDVLAYYYANRAQALGHPHAKKQLDELEQRMSRAEIAEAQKMSREWMKTRQ